MRHDYSTEQFQAFREEARESFWGQVRWQTQHVLQQILEADSEEQMARYLGLQPYERCAEPEVREDSRNGCYERDYVTPLGSIRLRVRRTRKRSFLPRGLQTLERLTRVLDQAVEKFHRAALEDNWVYLLLDGVWLKVRRAFGPQRVLLLVAYGVRGDGSRQLLAFSRARGESQAAWEASNCREPSPRT